MYQKLIIAKNCKKICPEVPYYLNIHTNPIYNITGLMSYQNIWDKNWKFEKLKSSFLWQWMVSTCSNAWFSKNYIEGYAIPVWPSTLSRITWITFNRSFIQNISKCFKKIKNIIFDIHQSLSSLHSHLGFMQHQLNDDC